MKVSIGSGSPGGGIQGIVPPRAARLHRGEPWRARRPRHVQVYLAVQFPLEQLPHEYHFAPFSTRAAITSLTSTLEKNAWQSFGAKSRVW